MNNTTSTSSALHFRWSQFFRWLLRTANRWIRGGGSRYQLCSPDYAKVQRVLDRRTGEQFRVPIRDAVDLAVLRQIFSAEDYRIQSLRRFPELRDWLQVVDAAGLRPLIIDLGANSGLASLYFSREYPNARILAVEPDGANMRSARTNLSGCAAVTLVHGGIASHDGTARLVDPGEGNWSYRTQWSDSGGTAMLSVPTLLSIYAGADVIPFIAKIDIEGFEQDLFETNVEWAERFPVIIIELHDWMLPKQGTSRAFLRWASALDRDFVHVGENLVSITNRLPFISPVSPGASNPSGLGPFSSCQIFPHEE